MGPPGSRRPHAGRPGHPLARHASDFLTDLPNANASAHTLRAYRGDLLQFCAHHDSEAGELTAATVRVYLADIAGLAASSRTERAAVILPLGGPP